MDDRDYALFAAIVEAGSLSAAARRLGLSPAMVSKRLARLEGRLGQRLIHRTTRALSPTAAGAAFHADIVAVLAAARAAEERVTGAARTPAGPLRVAMPTSFGRLHVAPILHRFLADHPAVTLDAVLSDALVDLRTDRFDMAIRIGADPPPVLHATRLAGSRRVLCASPTYLACHGAPADIAALSTHRLLAADGQLPWRLHHPRHGAATIDAASHVRTNSSELIRELAITGVGLALRSLWDIGNELASGVLVAVLPGWEGAQDVAIHAVHVPPATPAVAAMTTFLRDAFDPAPWDRTPPA